MILTRHYRSIPSLKARAACDPRLERTPVAGHTAPNIICRLMNSLLTAKLTATVVIFAAAMIGGLVPWRFARSTRGTQNIALGNAFAGGVLLAAGLIHLLGSATVQFATLWPHNVYPWPFAIAGAAFMFVLCIEQVIPGQQGGAAAPYTSGRDAAALGAAVAVDQTYPYLLLVVLSLHSLLVGLALGAQQTFMGIWIVFLAVIAHKSTTAFALGVSMFRVDIERSLARKLVVIFSCMTPLGVLLGAGATELLALRGREIFEALFDAIAAGTFLYIATLDILREEFVPSANHRVQKFLLASLGLVFMATLVLWV